MSQAINITTDTDYTLSSFTDVLAQGKKTVQFQSKGVTATIFLKFNDTQGYGTVGTSLTEGNPLQADIDAHTIFKVVFASGSVTAKIVG